jgi:ADP-heptose:LPS heptosyltransferase
MDNVGDVLLAGPAIRAVAGEGKRRVTLLCGPRGQAAAALLPGVCEQLVWRADWIDPEPEPLERARIDVLIAEIEARRFDEALILTSFHQSALPLALVLRMAGVPRVAAISEDYAGALLDVRHHVEYDAHEVQRGLSLAAACGYRLPRSDEDTLRVRRTAELDADAAKLGEYVVVHPGASVSARAWSARRCSQLVGLLTATGYNVVVTGADDEVELTSAVASTGKAGRVLDLGGRTDLAGLAEVLAAAQVVVVGNTGPAHLAAAVGTPVVSVYAPTVPPVRWHPWRVPFELLYRNVPCAGCRARECPMSGHPCIEPVDACEVLDAIARLAGGDRTGAPAGPHEPSSRRAKSSRATRGQRGSR